MKSDINIVNFCSTSRKIKSPHASMWSVSFQGLFITSIQPSLIRPCDLFGNS